MKKLFIFLVILYSSTICSQTNFQKFKKLSCPKKWWVIWHPFKAKRALQISNEAKRVADSIQKTNLLDGDASGGQVDAFRHAYWMATLRQAIGKNASRSLGKAHEKENYQFFKKQKLEDGVLPDEPSMKMDLYNNNVGLSFTEKKQKYSKNGLILKIVNAIKQGKMLMIKKDNNGNFLTCNNQKIDKYQLIGSWKNNKCLVKSNFKQ